MMMMRRDGNGTDTDVDDADNCAENSISIGNSNLAGMVFFSVD